jgi:hypothetical protein
MLLSTWIEPGGPRDERARERRRTIPPRVREERARADAAEARVRELLAKLDRNAGK